MTHVVGTPFQPGVSPNPGGRPRKLLRRLEETLHAAGLDPMKEVLKLIEDDSIAKNVKLKTWLEIFPYIYPKALPDPTARDKVIEDLAALSNGELIRRLEQGLETMKKSA